MRDTHDWWYDVLRTKRFHSGVIIRDIHTISGIMSGGQHVINRKIYLTVGGAEGRTLRP